MSTREGAPIWYELMTKDPEGAVKYYGDVMGWTFAAMPDAKVGDYWIASADGAAVAGIMLTPEHAQTMPDMWFAYFAVDDADAAAAKVEALGGAVDLAPRDIPGVGRFAFCRDPQGARFYVMRGVDDRDGAAFAAATPGHFGWNELVTSDQTAALGFYGALLGWAHGGAMPMGEMGDYTFVTHDGAMIGAMMTAPQKEAAPFWNFALLVKDVDAAKAAVEAGGGTVRMGPMELPDGSGWLIQTDDLHGAKIMFAGPRAA